MLWLYIVGANVCDIFFNTIPFIVFDSYCYLYCGLFYYEETVCFY